MVSATTIALINAFKDPILKSVKEISTEVTFFLDNGLSDYVESIKGKFENTKTFLYRNETVPFYETFFYVSLKHKNKVLKKVNENDLFKKSNYASIIGNAGSGKTMLIKHFFLNSINELYKIPIFIELRNLNDYDLSVIDYIYQVIFDNKLSPNKKILERLLDTGEFIFLLDGYDEIYSDKKNRITSDIDRFIDKYSKNKYIISSRPSSGIESLPRFNNFFVQPLSEKEISLFIDLVLKDNDDSQLGRKIKSVINKPENSDYKNFLRSPLLLSMFILTFNTYPELPKKKSKFYWNVFDTLATKHDSFTKKGGYQHERKTGLQNDEFEQILQWYSYISLFEGKFKFDAQYLTLTLDKIKNLLGFTFNTQILIEDLTLAIAILIIDGIEYTFPHKSLQEYFCANLIKSLEESNKKEIYEKTFANQVKLSTGGDENLWSLCEELDNASFTRNFLIMHLTVFVNQFKDLNDLETAKKIYSFSRFGDLISIDVESLQTTGFSYNPSCKIYFKIAKYLGLEDLPVLSFSSLVKNDKFFKFIKSRKEDMHYDDTLEAYSTAYTDLWCKDLETILVENEQMKKITTYIKNLKLKISELQTHLSENTNNMGLLLSLHSNKNRRS